MTTLQHIDVERTAKEKVAHAISLRQRFAEELAMLDESLRRLRRMVEEECPRVDESAGQRGDSEWKR